MAAHIHSTYLHERQHLAQRRGISAARNLVGLLRVALVSLATLPFERFRRRRYTCHACRDEGCIECEDYPGSEHR